MEPPNLSTWNLKYDGSSCAADFLERLEELREMHGVSEARMLRAMPLLLEGECLAWYRNNSVVMQTWDEFLLAFRKYFLRNDYFFDLEAKISRRVQGLDEDVLQYVTAMQTLCRRHGAIPPHRQLDWVKRNLRPEIKHMIWNKTYDDIRDLMEDAKAAQDALHELQAVYRVPRPESHQLPGNAAPRNAATVAAPTVITAAPKVVAAASTAAPRTAAAPSTVTAPGLAYASPRWRRRERRPSDQPERTSVPPLRAIEDSKTAVVPAEKKVVRFDAPNRENSSIVCWRCGQSGHYRSQCTGTAKLFCSRCERPGVLSRNCECPRPGNETRGG